MPAPLRPATRRLHPTGPALALVFGLTLTACSSGGAGSAGPASAGPSAMVEHSASPEASAMMEHSASPAVAAPVGMGTFHPVDGTARGTVALFHKPDGSFVITFEDFSVASNAHTNVIFVMNKDVTSDADIDKTKIVDLGPLKGTTSMQDFAVPASADAMTYHTVVLWDTEMTHAIAAAPLQ
jgi:hypothetical protein